jgi:hypothetical protein
VELNRKTMVTGYKLHFAIHRLTLHLIGLRLEKRFAQMNGHQELAQKCHERILRFEMVIEMLQLRLDRMSTNVPGLRQLH